MKKTSNKPTLYYIAFIGACTVYPASLLPWVIWVGMLLLGPDSVVPLLPFAWLVTLLYPIVITAGLLSGWYFHKKGEMKKSLWSLALPFLHILLLCVVGLATLWQV